VRAPEHVIIQEQERVFLNCGFFAYPRKERLISIRVIFADPDESLLAAYRELLRNEFHVATAPDALKCVRRLRHVVPDVLVLEPQLPWGGGEGVLSIMRDEPSLQDIPVMILTACRDPQILKRVAPFRISDYHVKPLAPAHLATRIRKLLDHRRQCARALDQRNRLERWNARRTHERIVDY
jgi:response regulator RpfG family c-di-GMP phosphodiesterase